MLLRLLPFLLLTCPGCAQPVGPGGDYYFPVRTFIQPTSYHFEDDMGSGRNPVWTMQMKVQGADTFLLTDIYDQTGAHIEHMEERIRAGRALLHTYNFFDEAPGGGPTTKNVTVLDSLVFDYHQQPGESIDWKTTLDLQGRSLTLSKSRKLLKEEGNRRYFEDHMHSATQGEPPFDYIVFTVYELNKGLISYRIEQDGEVKANYVLKKITSE